MMNSAPTVLSLYYTTTIECKEERPFTLQNDCRMVVGNKIETLKQISEYKSTRLLNQSQKS